MILKQAKVESNQILENKDLNYTILFVDGKKLQRERIKTLWIDESAGSVL